MRGVRASHIDQGHNSRFPARVLERPEIIDIECVLLCFRSQILSSQNGGFRGAFLLVPILRASKFTRLRGVKLFTISKIFCKKFYSQNYIAKKLCKKLKIA